jgi:hypothetical protein
MRTFISFVGALALMLALATSAFAQSSVEGYNDQAGQVQNQVQGQQEQANAPVTASNEGGGSLPFTGLDVALLLGAGGMLVVAGFGMRRLARAPGSRAA